MYKFANQQTAKNLAKWCEDILHKVQNEIRDYFTFDIRLIGSGDKKLITQNEDEAFDLDYNIIIQKDKQNLLNDPKQIKSIFVSKFNNVLQSVIPGCKYASDSTSVITLKLVQDGKINFSFDVAIIVENNDGVFYRLTNDKNTGRYIWNEIKYSSDYLEKFQQIKADGNWLDFKKRYLELKNMHLCRADGIKSFSIFLETLNEF
jgi:hypothetical protein